MAATGNQERLVDFAGGAMTRMARHDFGSELTEYRCDSRIKIRSDETLVLQAELPSKLRRQLVIHLAARLVEWQLHPYNLIPPLLPMFGQWDFLLRRPRLYRAFLRWLAGRKTAATVEFLQRVPTQRSLFFYDRPAQRATETYLGMQVRQPIFSPLAVAVPAAPERTGRIVAGDLHVAWVGVCAILSFIFLCARCGALATGKTVVSHVVGGGPKTALLDEFSAPLPGFRVKRHGDLEVPDLRLLFIAEADILASMGTAALEGTALGLPVLLLDLAYAAVPANYRFRWLDQAAG